MISPTNGLDVLSSRPCKRLFESNFVERDRVAMELKTMNDEIQPYLIFRIQGVHSEFALWQMKDGQRGICMFLSKESADIYRADFHQAAEWKTIQPDRGTLLEILKASIESGIRWAVLDPDQQKAKRIFDIDAIISSVIANPFLK